MRHTRHLVLAAFVLPFAGACLESQEASPGGDPDLADTDTDVAPPSDEIDEVAPDATATDDTSVPDVATSDANVGIPCLAIEPGSVSFGGKSIGSVATIEARITSCGTQPLELKVVQLAPGGSADFSLSMPDALPGSDGGIGPNQAPVVLQPNQSLPVRITYAPADVSPYGADGQPVLDRAILLVDTNVVREEIEITGFGADGSCPLAQIIVLEGGEVIPQTMLSLIGSQSVPAHGQIAEYRWSVEAPVGALPLFLPSANAADPRFEANVAGLYRFRLDVTDESGSQSCTPAEYTVVVTPDETIHIELLWHTPNDPDQTDEQYGADLDLHFTHPLAVGGFDGDGDGVMDGWFDLPFDTFWHNEQPNWGSIDVNVDDNPGLDRDDTDGGGPENLNLQLPEDVTYRVGVHYWEDHDYGPSFATVRIYFYGNLVFELAEVRLVEKDMWYVTDIVWGPNAKAPEPRRVCGGTFESCDDDSDCGSGACVLRIAPNYRHPEFFQP